MQYNHTNLSRAEQANYNLAQKYAMDQNIFKLETAADAVAHAANVQAGAGHTAVAPTNTLRVTPPLQPTVTYNPELTASNTAPAEQVIYQVAGTPLQSSFEESSPYVSNQNVTRHIDVSVPRAEIDSIFDPNGDRDHDASVA